MVLEGKKNQFRIALEIEQGHDAIFVEHDRLLADPKYLRYFLHRTAFGQQLQYFPLARG